LMVLLPSYAQSEDYCLNCCAKEISVIYLTEDDQIISATCYGLVGYDWDYCYYVQEPCLQPGFRF